MLDTDMIDFIGIHRSEPKALGIVKVICKAGMFVDLDIHALPFFDNELMADHI